MGSQVTNTIPGYQEFPKWKYQGGPGAAGKAVLVNSVEEEAKLGDGWADAPSDVVPEPVVDPRDAEIASLKAQLAAKEAEHEPTRDELKAKAAELGIEFAPNIPTAKLAELIAAKEAE